MRDEGRGGGGGKHAPWSNSSPSALLLLVFRACLPSMLSSVEYANMHSASSSATHAGIDVAPSAGA
jgi:hypothetical protein